MPILLAALGIAAAVYFYVIRARNAAHVATDLLDVAADIQAAARRFGFRRRADIHPVEAIDDPDLALALTASAFTELDDLPTEETRRRLANALTAELRLTPSASDEMLILARWLTTECKGAAPAVERAARKLNKLRPEHITPLMKVISAVAGDSLSDRQRDALEDIKRAFRIR